MGASCCNPATPAGTHEGTAPPSGTNPLDQPALQVIVVNPHAAQRVTGDDNGGDSPLSLPRVKRRPSAADMPNPSFHSLDSAGVDASDKAATAAQFSAEANEAGEEPSGRTGRNPLGPGTAAFVPAVAQPSAGSFSFGSPLGGEGAKGEYARFSFDPTSAQQKSSDSLRSGEVDPAERAAAAEEFRRQSVAGDGCRSSRSDDSTVDLPPALSDDAFRRGYCSNALYPVTAVEMAKRLAMTKEELARPFNVLEGVTFDSEEEEEEERE